MLIFVIVCRSITTRFLTLQTPDLLMSELYPLKFEPLLKEKIWGGETLSKHYGKSQNGSGKIGESWEISAVSDNLSVVSNGFLAGNNIEELIEVYLGDITGDQIYEKFGAEFPLLIKLVEARENLSVQVHPGNDAARERHGAYGKTEMWYIIESETDAKIYTGFREPVTREIYTEALEKGEIVNLLNAEDALPGDTFFTPAGRIHAIGAGILLAEIQQTSDITYRIYDWGRIGPGNNIRELHNDLAPGVIDFNAAGETAVRKRPLLNKSENLVSCEFFTTNIMQFDRLIGKNYNLLDSFVVYLCTEGRFRVKWKNGEEMLVKGETCLLPACIREVILVPETRSTVLEIYIETT